MTKVSKVDVIVSQLKLKVQNIEKIFINEIETLHSNKTEICEIDMINQIKSITNTIINRQDHVKEWFLISLML